jgi:mannose-1-phosphate guanylyltransferase / mannose-6-phosphate isomerase
LIELGITPTMIQPVIICAGNDTRLQETGAHCHGLEACIEPLVICNEAHRSMVASAILLEGADRGSAPALTLAAVHSVTADDPVLLALTCEHIGAQNDVFKRAVSSAAAFAQQGYIVAFGVPPGAGETRCSYMRTGTRLAKQHAFFIDAFVGDSAAARAQQYGESKSYLCSAGIFAVRASVWIDTIGNLRPDVLASCERAYRRGKREGAFLRVDGAFFSRCPSDSIECAVMEKLNAASPEAIVVRLDAYAR